MASASKVWQLVQIGVFFLNNWMFPCQWHAVLWSLVQGSIEAACILVNKHGYLQFSFQTGYVQTTNHQGWQVGFEPMTSGAWSNISCHWNSLDYSTISNLNTQRLLHTWYKWITLKRLSRYNIRLSFRAYYCKYWRKNGHKNMKYAIINKRSFLHWNNTTM